MLTKSAMMTKQPPFYVYKLQFSTNNNKNNNEYYKENLGVTFNKNYFENNDLLHA